MEVFLALLIILVVARVFGELASWMRLPAILGEVLAGVGLGVAILLWPGQVPILGEIVDNRVFTAIADLGIFFLMFTAGMEVTLGQLVKASRQGIPVALGGVIIPILMALVIGLIFVPTSAAWTTQVFFLGVAMAITAVPISIRTLMDIGALNSRPGSVIVDAAVLDDLVGIVLLVVLVGMIQTGDGPNGLELTLLTVRVIGFLALAIAIGYLMLPRVDRLMSKAQGPEMHFTTILVLGAALAVLSETVGLHFMVGAFVAGVMVRDRMTENTAILDKVDEKLRGVTTGFLAPIFFASRGLYINLAAFQIALPFTLTVIGVALVSKLVGCAIPAKLTGMSSRESLAVGVGMSGRGGVELVIASAALQAGLFTSPEPVPPVVAAMYSAVIVMAIFTSLVAPVGLRILLRDQSTKIAEPESTVP